MLSQPVTFIAGCLRLVSLSALCLHTDNLDIATKIRQLRTSYDVPTNSIYVLEQSMRHNSWWVMTFFVL